MSKIRLQSYSGMSTENKTIYVDDTNCWKSRHQNPIIKPLLSWLVSNQNAKKICTEIS